MAVVCAGPKAILDVPATLEYLETRGVPVVTIGQDELPGFYAPLVGASGRRIRARRGRRGRGSSPRPPRPGAGRRARVRAGARGRGARRRRRAGGRRARGRRRRGGRDRRPGHHPWLLARIAEITDGASVRANTALIVNDARVAGELAVRLALRESPEAVAIGAGACRLCIVATGRAASCPRSSAHGWHTTARPPIRTVPGRSTAGPDSHRPPPARSRSAERPAASPSTSAGIRRIYNVKPKPVVALDGVDLEVEPGEFFGLLGPNGAGKTTLIKILTTLLLPSEGTARIFGFDVERQTKQIRRIMNMVAGGEQSGYGILTVREQLWMFSQFYGLPSRDGWNRVDELIDAVGLDEQREQRVSTLSTGQRQKMNFARGLLNDPWILFLDEPTLGLDVAAARSVRELVARLEGGGARPDGPPHDPLHGRGRRAVRPDRDRRPRPDPGHRHARTS